MAKQSKWNSKSNAKPENVALCCVEAKGENGNRTGLHLTLLAQLKGGELKVQKQKAELCTFLLGKARVDDTIHTLRKSSCFLFDKFQT